MLKNVYEGLNATPKVYLLKEYFCKMYPTCVSSKLCEFIPGMIDGNSTKFLHFHQCIRFRISTNFQYFIIRLLHS